MVRARRTLSFKAFLVVLFWGVSFVATRLALEALTPVGLVAARMLIGAASMLVLAVIVGRLSWPEPRDRARCVLLGLILAVHLLIQAFGLLKTTATNSAWIIAFTPVVIAVGAWLFLRERVGRRAWAGIVLGTAGVLAISLATGLSFSDAKVGDLMQLTSCGTWAAYTLLAVGPVTRDGSLRVTLASVTVATAASLLPTLGRPWTCGAITAPVVLSVAFLGIVCSGLAYWLWYSAMRDIGSTRSGAYLYLEPFVTWVVAALVLGERLRPLGIVGGLMVLGGVWVVSSTGRTAQ